MSSVKFNLMCLIWPDDRRRVFVVEIDNNEIFADVQDKIKDKRAISLRHVEACDLVLWKCAGLLGDDDLDQALKTIQFDGSDVRLIHLNGWQRISQFFGDDDLSKEPIHILVENPALYKHLEHADLRTKKRSLEVEDTVAKRQRFSEARELDTEVARMALPPSSAAMMPAFQTEQEKRPVLNGRPDHNFGLPVGLFHPVFNSFHAAMRSPERFYADTKTYSSVKDLFKTFADIYSTEEKRTAAIDEHLNVLLDNIFIVVEGPGVKSDGVIVENCGPSIAYVAVREIKNEIGTGSADPYNEAGLAYRKYWAGESQEIIRRSSHCPSIILAIAGPWLCVLGGIYLQKAVIQPLTDYVWLGGDFFDEDRLLFASRLFTALKSAISTLKVYYRDLAPRRSQTLISDSFPFITEYGSKKFTYLSRLAPEYPTKLLYKAQLDNEDRMVLVKFVSTYNAQAHRILAERQLAPTLHYAGTEDTEASMYGRQYMIVMDFIEGKTAVLDSLSERQLDQVRQAIQLLHSHDLVFGDLRSPNILIADENEDVMIIDYDWCGKAREARYPATLNPANELGWPEGVGPDSVMMKEHDLVLLEKLA